MFWERRASIDCTSRPAGIEDIWLSAEKPSIACGDKKKGKVRKMHFPFSDLEREKSLELSTYTLARYRSTN